MPFTFSHPSLVLPAKFLPEKLVSMTALIIGSITPDFEYFIRMKNYSVYSHTWAGIFWFDLPLGLLLTFIYHGLVRDKLIINLPGFGYRRMAKYQGFNWNNYFKNHVAQVIICLLIGITSHVAWDAFTHPRGYFVEVFPWLKQNSEVFGVFHTRFHILQVASSWVGGIVVIIALFNIPVDKSVSTNGHILKYWFVVIIIAATVFGLRVLSGLNLHSVADAGVCIISAGLVALVLAPQILKLF